MQPEANRARPDVAGDPALVRLRSAFDRTVQAWTRTGFAFVALGLVIARFGYYLRELAGANRLNLPAEGFFPIGVLHMLLGMLMLIVAVIRQAAGARALAAGRPDRATPMLTRNLVVALAVASILGAGWLATQILADFRALR